MKKSLRWLGGSFSLVALYLGWVLIPGTLTDYQPPAKDVALVTQDAADNAKPDSVISLAIWNMGYAGLGAESDFFYEHSSLLSNGHMIRAPRPLTERNLKAAVDFVKQTQTDFFLFQEVDLKSRRSYFMNEFAQLAAAAPDFHAAFFTNYQVKRVPVPILEPWRAYGAVHSGIATLSRYQPEEVTRIQLPGAFAWPTRIFQLDRCLGVESFALDNGKKLIVINLHNSAYDKDGAMKAQELQALKALVLAEYAAGNYVIVGGDWNQCPPFFPCDTFREMPEGYGQFNMAADLLTADWQWIYDPTTPTNRKVDEVYDPEKTFVTLIDYFLVSPNIQIKKVRTIDQGFQFSDHQPVWMEVVLKQ